MDRFLHEVGCEAHDAPQGAPQRNPIAEAHLKKVQDMMRTLLVQCQLANTYWSYAATHANLILNWLVDENGSSPYRRFHGRDPPLRFLKPFGCKVITHINKEKRPLGKLGHRGARGIYVGFNELNNSHLVLHYNSDGVLARKAVDTVHIDFDYGSILRDLEPWDDRRQRQARSMPTVIVYQEPNSSSGGVVALDEDVVAAAPQAAAAAEAPAAGGDQAELLGPGGDLAEAAVGAGGDFAEPELDGGLGVTMQTSTSTTSIKQSKLSWICNQSR